MGKRNRHKEAWFLLVFSLPFWRKRLRKDQTVQSAKISDVSSVAFEKHKLKTSQIGKHEGGGKGRGQARTPGGEKQKGRGGTDAMRYPSPPTKKPIKNTK